MNFEAMNIIGGLTSEKPVIKIGELQLYEKYQMLSTKRVTTSYGERILVELENFVVFLPDRLAYITSEECEKYNTDEKKYALVYKGDKLCANKKKTVLVELVKMET